MAWSTGLQKRYEARADTTFENLAGMFGSSGRHDFRRDLHHAERSIDHGSGLPGLPARRTRWSNCTKHLGCVFQPLFWDQIAFAGFGIVKSAAHSPGTSTDPSSSGSSSATQSQPRRTRSLPCGLGRLRRHRGTRRRSGRPDRGPHSTSLTKPHSFTLETANNRAETNPMVGPTRQCQTKRPV
jgi:hypothetical protein